MSTIAALSAACSSSAELPAFAERTEAATNSAVEVRLTENRNAEAMLAQVLSAAHEQLMPVCSAHPEGSIRVVDPLDPARYTDVTCAAILERVNAAGLAGVPAMSERSSEPLTSQPEERVGEAQQRWSPLGLLCGLFVTGVAIGLTEACKAHNPGNPQCEYAPSGGAGIIGAMLCALL